MDDISKMRESLDTISKQLDMLIEISKSIASSANILYITEAIEKTQIIPLKEVIRNPNSLIDELDILSDKLSSTINSLEYARNSFKLSIG